ncbi:rRNA-processing protein EFG1 [Parastagonospora nodorum]|nr:rRNA-processing protein EFG1 [Parastagonospora nodorum]
MSQKRKHDETPGDASSASKTFKKHRPFKPGQNHQQTKHHRRPNLSHDDENGRSTNALKSRIRDLKRFLTHMDSVEKHKMSAGARQERERELEACEHELAEKLNASREAEYRKKMIGKYHQVRFFDRQKGTRILKRLKKELSALEDDSKKTALQQRIHNAEVDVNYAIYYPLMKPYSSLYPKSKNKKSSDSEEAEDTGEDSKNSAEVDGPKGDVNMWKAIEEAMQDGTLEKLRYSKDAVPAEPPKKSKKPKAKDSKKEKSVSKTSHDASASHNYAVQDQDEDSDGGFFE